MKVLLQASPYAETRVFAYISFISLLGRISIMWIRWCWVEFVWVLEAVFVCPACCVEQA